MGNDQKLNDLFAKAKGQKSKLTFEETATVFKSSLSMSKSATKFKVFTFKNSAIMLGIVGVILTSISFLMGNNGEMDSVKTQNTGKGKTHKTELIKTENVVKNEVVLTKDLRGKSLEISTLSFKKIQPLKSINNGVLLAKKASKIQDSKQMNQDYVFPKLTQDEIEANHKQKKNMLKALVKIDSDVYSYIPSGSFEFEGKVVSVQGFMMQKTEVTNLEYRTFLFDLLIQGRKEEFKIAAPEQSKWVEYLSKEGVFWKDNYFSDTKYNNYPVVNITRKGAEMYCSWFSDEVQKFIMKEGVKKNDHKMNDVRLPYKPEWIKAASMEGKLKSFAWEDNPSPTCFQSNFSTKGYNRPAFINKKSGKKELFGDTSAVSTAGYLRQEGDLTTKVGSYDANVHGVHDLSGNVAEMAYDSGIGSYSKTNPIALGGGWMSTEENIKIYSKETYNGVSEAHPNIGFRVVMTLLPKNWQIVEP